MSKPKEKLPLWNVLLRLAAASAIAALPLSGMSGLLLPESAHVYAFLALFTTPPVLLIAGLGLGVTEVLALRKHREKASEHAEAVPADSAEVSPT